MSEIRPVQIVDAFTTEPMAGNPAGVVPEAAGLADDQMAAIAGELGASETAFVLPSEDADRRLRYFTPEREIDLCGHATVAAFGSLYDRAVVSAGTYTVETAAGQIEVEIEAGGRVWLTGASPTIRTVDQPLSAIAAALGVDEPALAEVGADLPVAAASAGLPFLVVPVSYFEQLSAIEPDLAAVETLCTETETEGLYAFTFDTLEAGATLHGRAFLPGAGIPEDPVTGTASGAVGAYLRQYDALEAADPLVFEQGHFLDRPGRVLVDTGVGDRDAAAGAPAAGDAGGGGEATDGDELADERRPLPAPRIGGRAVTTVEGECTIPAPDEDDIIEV